MVEHERLEMQESCQVGRETQNFSFVHFTGKKEKEKRDGKSSKAQNCVNLKTV